MTAQHTPGPWIAYEWECSSRFKRFNDAGNRFWGIKPEKFHYGAAYLDASGWMSEANARLIAEAPAMLEALRAWAKYDYNEMSGADCMFNYAEAIDATRAILARIDGDTK